MKAIWKYPLAVVDGIQTRKIPIGATFCHVGNDPRGPGVAVWFHVDSARSEESRDFMVVGTGHPVPEQSKYLGSASQNGFIWHVLQLR